MDHQDHDSGDIPSNNAAPAPSLLPLIIVAIVYAALDLSAMPFVWWLTDDELPALFLFLSGIGLFLSQFGILPVWLVWGNRPFWQRLIIHWGLASGLILCWSLGLLVVMQAETDAFPPAEFFWREIASTLLCLPAVSLGIEGPLRLARFFFHWRLSTARLLRQNPPPLAIRDFLWGMGVISVALACLRAATELQPPWQESELWIVVGMTVGIASMASALVLLPFPWCILRWKRAGAGILAIIVYTLLWGAVILSSLRATVGLIPDPLFVPGVFWFLGCFAASIAAGLGLMRRAGYRLEVGKPRAE